jgi:threonine/homoserine/homoserine lactone efflux protein
VYLAVLAWKIATAAPITPRQESGTAPSLLGGLLLGVANPKAYLALSAVLAGSHSGIDTAGIYPGLKVAVLAAMIVMIHAAWLLAGTALAGALSRPSTSRALNVSMASLLLLSTLWSVWSYLDTEGR